MVWTGEGAGAGVVGGGAGAFVDGAGAGGGAEVLAGAEVLTRVAFGLGDADGAGTAGTGGVLGDPAPPVFETW